VLYPPENRPNYNLDYASRHWMEYSYQSLKNWTTDDFEREHENHEQFLKQWRRRSLDSSSDRKQGASYTMDESKGPSKKSRGNAQSTLARCCIFRTNGTMRQ